MAGEFHEEFNALLTGEISAVETYDLALEKSVHADVKRILSECRACHQKRVELLTKNVNQLGCNASRSGGILGAWNNFVQGAAGTERDAIAVLEEAEAEKLVQYESQAEFLPGAVKAVMQNDLIPAQHETHLKLSVLLKQLDEQLEMAKHAAK